MSGTFALRRYRDADEDAAIELWRRTWQLAYPGIDFSARLDWWRKRWRNELVPAATIVVGEDDAAALAGFVTIDDKGYLDQIVVAPEAWGTPFAKMLLDEAKRLSPSGVSLLVNLDNFRAIKFYQKNAFVADGEDVNPTSGRKVLRMVWRP
jgi:putative acetyltransferase